MTDVILALNAGSTSLKFSLFLATHDRGALSLLYQGEVEGLGNEPRFLVDDSAGQRLLDKRLNPAAPAIFSHEEALGVLLDWIERHETGLRPVGVGHRVVHGGSVFSAPALVDAAVLAQLEQLVPLAPLHQPHNLAAIRAVARQQPALGAGGLFRYGLSPHPTPVAQAFALPHSLSDRGVKRYGFHGLSYEYIASVLPT